MIRRLLTARWQHKQLDHHFRKLSISSSPSPSKLISPSSKNFKILPEVQEAINANHPVVALESTILSHGLPYPENKQLSKDISDIIRSKGAVPATIAVKDGVCHVGLNESDIDDLVISGVEGRAVKCSTRDLPFILARHQQQYQQQQQQPSNGMKHQWGATTVASTMRLAHIAGISTFVTGGTGGVHRNAENTMDISADIIELSRTPIIVISAGIKSILDIEKTLEVIETFGISIASYQSNDFPAFFSPSSGIVSPMRIDSADEIANSYYNSLDLGLDNGMLIAVPNDDPAGEKVEYAIRETLDEVELLGITGRDVTPHILKRVSEKTDGDSLRSNTALVKRNAEVGADIAVSVAKYKNKYCNIVADDNNSTGITISGSVSGGNNGAESIYCEDNNTTRTGSTSSPSATNIEKSRVVVVGGSVIDIVAKSKQNIISSTSNPGSCSESDGGVGRNIAQVLGQLGAKPILYTAVGDDSRGKALRQRMVEEYDIPYNRQYINTHPKLNTATYLAILNNDGDLHNAIADMDVLHEIPLPNDDIVSSADYLVIDANPPINTLTKLVQSAKQLHTKVVYDPTSVPKSALMRGNDDFLSCISFAFPNVDELLVMTDNDDFVHGDGDGNNDDNNNYEAYSRYERSDLYKDDFQKLKKLTVNVLDKMHPEEAHLVVTMGAKGVFLASKETTIHCISSNTNIESSSSSQFAFQHFPTKKDIEIENCTGAGDTMVGVFVKCLLDGETIVTSIEKGMDASIKSLQFVDGAIPKFSNDSFT